MAYCPICKQQFNDRDDCPTDRVALVDELPVDRDVECTCHDEIQVIVLPTLLDYRRTLFDFGYLNAIGEHFGQFVLRANQSLRK